MIVLVGDVAGTLAAEVHRRLVASGACVTTAPHDWLTALHLEWPTGGAAPGGPPDGYLRVDGDAVPLRDLAGVVRFGRPPAVGYFEDAKAVVGRITDEVTAFLAGRLARLGVPFVAIDPRLVGTSSMAMSWQPGGEHPGTLRYGARIVDLATIGAWYLRELGTSPFAGATAALTEYLNVTRAAVLNTPRSQASNGSKPYQALRIREQGFAVPATLVTTDPSAARRFHEEWDGQVIHKSISWIRSIVVPTAEADLERLQLLRNGPVQFQQLVEGTDVRVHVVGERLFATEVSTTAVDYRYASREGAARTLRDVTLPEAVAARCVALHRALGLRVSGIDLRRDPDGRWWCFEVNTSPGFTFYQAQTGQPIGHAIVDLLRGSAPVPPPRPRGEG